MHYETHFAMLFNKLLHFEEKKESKTFRKKIKSCTRQYQLCIALIVTAKFATRLLLQLDY